MRKATFVWTFDHFPTDTEIRLWLASKNITKFEELQLEIHTLYYYPADVMAAIQKVMLTLPKEPVESPVIVAQDAYEVPIDEDFKDWTEP